jgi:NAD(P)-dependent dehydrogenase (short-subunit alcohol dehydrogenase family)
MELNGRHAIVTGAGSGIGRALARRFAAEGAKVVVADIHEDAADAVARDIEALAVTVDVGQEDQVKSLVWTAREQYGPVDLFFSNAGIGGPAGGPLEVADAEWRTIWDVNVMAHIYAARAVLPEMLERGEGYIASTASAAGLLTQISAAPYSVTKHAAVALAEWLAITYGDAGIKFSVLCPQGVRTPMLDEAMTDAVGSAPLLAEGVLDPEEVAEAVVEGLRAESFLILPHPVVAEYMAIKATQPERWLRGMRRVLRDARAAASAD